MQAIALSHSMSSMQSSYRHLVQGGLVVRIILGVDVDQEQSRGQELDLVSTSVLNASSPSRVSQYPYTNSSDLPQRPAQECGTFGPTAALCPGQESSVSGLNEPSLYDEFYLGSWHNTTTHPGEATDLSDDVTLFSLTDSTKHSRNIPGIGDRTDPDRSSNLDHDPRYNAVEAPPAVLQSLIETVQRGLVPSTTASTGLLCGIHALVGSLNAAFPHQGTPLRVEHVMRTMFLNYDSPDQAPRLTPEYDAFVRLHLENKLHLTAGEDGYEGIWEALTAPNNFGADQLAVLLRFLHQQGMVDREFDVGVLAAENGHRGDLATAHITGIGGVNVPVIWLHNDNAMRHLGAEYNHWSMFAKTTDPSDPWRQLLGLDSQDDGGDRTSLEHLPSEHDTPSRGFPDVADDLAFSKDYIHPFYYDLETICEPGEYNGENVTAYAGHADSAQLSERVLSPLLEGRTLCLSTPSMVIFSD
ncbi:hypothetical protein LTR75_012911 [Friedmanniomyces endolithicus]|nr:hypothetical protein LTR75_012911 [Friedmanniomyces endolithicus]